MAEKSERGVGPTGEPRPQPCSLTRSPPSPSTHKACGQTQPRDTDTPQAGLPTPVAPKGKGKLMRNETREAAARPSADRTSSLLVPTAHASQPLCRPPPASDCGLSAGLPAWHRVPSTPPSTLSDSVLKHKTGHHSPAPNPPVAPAALGIKSKLLSRQKRLLLNWPLPACSDSSRDTASNRHPHASCPITGRSRH